MLRALTCVSQSYDWGKLGSSSAVAILRAAGTGLSTDETIPYAEYWFGTHPSGPSRLRDEDGALLHDWLLAHPDVLGVAPYAAGSALPYLLKVLSVGKALSIQTHPDAARAVVLHATRPDLYKDGNHKPEMALALTPFDALCSFRSPQDAAAQLRRAPELLTLAGALASELLIAAGNAGDTVAYAIALKPWFAALCGASPADVKLACTALTSRLALPAPTPPPLPPSFPSGVTPLDADDVASRLLAQYPDDVGVFAPYFLNALTLAPGVGLFLGAGEPHAYLSGDCVEVMACSDNVIRAGLTPKFKDAETLIEMLTYNVSGVPAVVCGAPAKEPHTLLYACPVPEFALDAVLLPAGSATYLRIGPSAAILVVFKGDGVAIDADGVRTPLSAGAVWLQPATAGVRLEAGASGLQIYRSAAATV